MLWVPGQETAWVLLMDEPPDRVELGAYGMRVWIEQGFRMLKRMGWQWHRTRRLDRHWLVQAQRLLHRGYAWSRVWLQPLPGSDPPGELQWGDPPTG